MPKGKNEWSLTSNMAMNLITSYLPHISGAVCASDRTVRAMTELNGPVNTVRVRHGWLWRLFNSDSPEYREIQEHPVHFRYDDEHTDYAECVLEVKDVKRVERVLWWLQLVGVRSLCLANANALASETLHHLVSVVLCQRSLTVYGKALPTVLEELTFKGEYRISLIVYRIPLMESKFEEAALAIPHQYPCLRKLRIDSHLAKSLDGIEELTELEVLHIGCATWRKKELLKTCKHLQELRLYACEDESVLELLPNLPALTDLCLVRMNIAYIPSVERCVRLRKVSLQQCDRFTYLTHLGQIPLTDLDVENTNVDDLRPIQDCTQLQKLNLYKCQKLCSVSPLQKLTSLRSLDLSFTKVKSLTPLQACLLMEKLNLKHCKELQSLKGLEKMSLLTDLYISYTEVNDLRPLENCCNMRRLEAYCCSRVTSLEGLENMTSLRDLRMSFGKLKDLKPLQRCTQLQHLELYYCRDVRSLEGLENMKLLEYLDIGTTEVTDLSALNAGAPLKILHLCHCYRVDVPATINRFPHVETIYRRGDSYFSDKRKIADEKKGILKYCEIEGCTN